MNNDIRSQRGRAEGVAIVACLLEREARARQAALLRSILPDPFAQPAPPVRGEVFAGTDEDPDMLALYCDGCAPRRVGLQRMVIFDLRGYCCSACRRPLGVRVH